MEPDPFDYVNRTGRPTGAFVSVAGLVLRGVRTVQEQIEPYAHAWRAANLAALRRPGPRWIVMGDSMSQGVGASRFDTGWVNQVQHCLADDDRYYNVVNLSASGARVNDVLHSQVPAWRALAAGRHGDTDRDVITVLVGSNDLMRKHHRTRLAATFASLLRELPAGAVVATMPQPRQAALAVNRHIADAVRDAGLIAADMSNDGGLSAWKGKLAPDHFHPNDLGYADTAAAFYRAIVTRIEQPAHDAARQRRFSGR